jgi:hypothetical protein
VNSCGSIHHPLTNKCGAEHPARPTFSKSPQTLHFTQAGWAIKAANGCTPRNWFESGKWPLGALKSQINSCGYRVQLFPFFQPISGHNLSQFFPEPSQISRCTEKPNLPSEW